MTETHVLPMPPPKAQDDGLTFTTGWTDENAAALARILAEHDPLGEGDAAIQATPVDARLIVVAWTDGQAVAFLAGRRIVGTDLALCSYFRGLTQWHGKYRVGLALWGQWVGLCRAEAVRTIVIGIDGTDPPDYRRRVEKFVRLAGFTQYAESQYAESGPVTWHRLEVG